MSRYINAAGTIAAIGRGEGLKVVVTNPNKGQVIQSGALSSEDQTDDDYMATLGFSPLGDLPGFGDDTYSIQLDVAGKISAMSENKHWSVELAEAMTELAESKEAMNEANARYNKAVAAFERAKSNAENSIIGT